MVSLAALGSFRVESELVFVESSMMMAPEHLELDKDHGLLVRWADGHESHFPVGYLRRMSPSAEQRKLREEMESNPLVVLPNTSDTGPLRAINAELVGRYAVRISFSDGHDTGIFTWQYLREIDPKRTAEDRGG